MVNLLSPATERLFDCAELLVRKSTIEALLRGETKAKWIGEYADEVLRGLGDGGEFYTEVSYNTDHYKISLCYKLYSAEYQIHKHIRIYP